MLASVRSLQRGYPVPDASDTGFECPMAFRSDAGLTSSTMVTMVTISADKMVELLLNLGACSQLRHDVMEASIWGR